MKRLILAAVAVFVITGCGKDGPSDAELDKTEIESMISSSEWFGTTKYQDNDSSSASKLGKSEKGDALIDVLWWRGIPPTGRQWNINISVSGDSAYVEWELKSTGKFNLLGKLAADSVGYFGQKTLKETSRMDAVYKRTGNTDETNRGWELEKLSGAIGSSDDVHTVRIDSVRIQCASYPDTILTDALETLFNKDNALTFAPQEDVTVTLYTNTSDGEAYLHVFQPNFPWHIRILMENNGDKTYTNATPWHVQVIPAVRFAVFDLMHHNTIYDTDYAYDFDGWLYPYVVE
jgi:hypothetical protein